MKTNVRYWVLEWGIERLRLGSFWFSIHEHVLVGRENIAFNTWFRLSFCNIFQKISKIKAKICTVSKIVAKVDIRNIVWRGSYCTWRTPSHMIKMYSSQYIYMKISTAIIRFMKHKHKTFKLKVARLMMFKNQPLLDHINITYIFGDMLITYFTKLFIKFCVK